MTRAYRKWTEAEREAARNLRAEGKGYILIGRAIGRPSSSVESFFFRERKGGYTLGRTCLDCPADLPDRNTSGRCRRCFLRHGNSDPAFTARRLNGLRASPVMQAGSPLRSATARKAATARMANPEYVAWLRAHMRDVVAPRGLAAIAKMDRTDIGKRQSEQLMAWCPPEYRDFYRYIKRHKGLGKPEAQAIIRAQIKADEARLSPFERQERALARGGQLVANDAQPSLYAAQAKWSVG